ncbi:MAG: hypothetical protein ACK47B_02370 [Armatimonadota bacterium]
MERYRITTTGEDGVEQTWVLLPDEPSAAMQAEELSTREKTLHVRVYREVVEPPAVASQEQVRDFPPRKPRAGS